MVHANRKFPVDLLLLILLFTGAGLHGCMGAVNNGVRSENGQIIGISHELFRGGDHRIENKIVS